jgi:hypothetical protein
VNSQLTEDFIACFGKLPNVVKEQARKNYRLWKKDPYYPSLHFKQVHAKDAIYSVRIGRGWRALGLVEGNLITWFWIGSHADCDKLLSQL